MTGTAARKPIACIQDEARSNTVIFAGVPINARRIAAAAGMDHSYVWRVISGDREPSLAVAKRIAAALGMDHIVFLQVIEDRRIEREAQEAAQVKAYNDRVEKENLADIQDYRQGRPVKPRPQAFRLA
jgi:transcriptional regulator with XRE-family HTH domain